MSSILLSSSADRWSWSLDGFDSFSVSSARSEIDENLLIVSDTMIRWCHLTPIKVNVLVGRLFLNKLPSRYNLFQGGLETNSIFCPICEKEVKTNTYLFFKRDLAGTY